MEIGASVHTLASHRGPWIVCALVSPGSCGDGVNLVRQPAWKRFPEQDLMDLADLAERQLGPRSAPFEAGQVTEIRGETVRFVALTWWWRLKTRCCLFIRPERMLRVVPV
ncbi:hypothetical protein [Amycolatopsis sp. NPDC004079]|uniref:hypothetical protein n=1 Tax=Amycolatopsis sp. NPDC004079 TaxID=3154549 RepID=UPI0033B7DA8B